MIPHIHTSYANQSIYKRLVRVSGPGTLTGLGVTGALSYHFFRIRIDGNLIVEDFLCGSLTQNFENNGLGVNLPFEKELIVEIRDSVPSPLPRFWVSFTTSHSKKVKEEIKVVKINEMTYVYKTEVLEWNKKQYTIEKLLGNERISEVFLENDTYFPEEVARGIIRLRDWKGEKLAEKVYLLLKLIGRTRVLYKLDIGYVHGEKEFEFRTPRFSGTFEIVANLYGYANFPAIFTVI